MQKHLVHGFGRQEGQQLVQVALMLPVLFAFIGLVLDVGYVYARRRTVQGAVDAAASAGAMVLYEQGGNVASNTARWYAGQHGYDNDGVENVVTVTTPPSCLRVEIQENVEPVFASLVWNGTFPVRAHAIACAIDQTLGASVIVLNETACGALSMDGNNSRITARHGNIHVNSNCGSAVDLGNGDILSETALTIRGGYSSGPNGNFEDLHGNPLPPLLNQPLLPDPLAGLPAPSSAGMTVRSVPKKPTTLLPGLYPDGIKLSGNTDVVLSAGIYYLEDDFSVSGTATVSGDGVIIYIASGSLDLSGNRAFNLTAPTSGTYEGIALFQARDNTTQSHLTGTTDSVLEGIVYLPKSELWISGNSTLETNFVADKVRLNGNPDLSVLGFDSQYWTTHTSALTE